MDEWDIWQEEQEEAKELEAYFRNFYAREDDDNFIKSYNTIKQAAKHIDAGEYKEFEKIDLSKIDYMIYPHFGMLGGELIRDDGTELSNVDIAHWAITNEVKSLAGIKYLHEKGIIPDPNRYFTCDQSLLSASAEQLEFYVANGANINAIENTAECGFEYDENLSILDKAVFNGYPQSYVNKLIELGGQRGCKKSGNAIHSIISALSYPDRDEVLSDFKLLNEKGMLKEEEKAAIAVELSWTRNPSNEEKNLISKVSSLKNKNIDYLQLKMDMVREKLGHETGKTADTKTGEIHQEHHDTARRQSYISKQIMNLKKQNDK